MSTGLSPRVRGNPPRRRLQAPRRGSIPACAGEPLGGHSEQRPCRVYPRVCGGTSRGLEERHRREGLSPRVRGNPPSLPCPNQHCGSIPACAGEPLDVDVVAFVERVYPRVCGGTTSPATTVRRGGGLSPRVRGNHEAACRAAVASGSIPACAGEPTAAGTSTGTCRVYPRVCGGTKRGRDIDRDVQGLSPRVRGNQARLRCAPAFPGSIPACAGEPRRVGPRNHLVKVYPRVCGGTLASRNGSMVAGGLSPRVRGNRGAPAEHQAPGGSIPACAGEPADRRAGWGEEGVYPRVCGGTVR